MSTPPGRDRAFVAQKYGEFWGNVRDFVRGLAAQGGIDLESALQRTMQFSNGTEAGDFCAPLMAPETLFRVRGKEVPLTPIPLEYVWRDLVAHEVLRAMRKDVEAVIELGSGWSANIFTLWLRGAPRAAAYFGGELIEGGRQAAEALAALRPSMRFSAPPFDWSNPDFDFIPPQARHVTVYSCHSIEQIPQLDAGVLRGLLERTAAAETVRGVFIEPVGWQFPEFASQPEVTERSRAYSLERNYNSNLRQVMERLGEEKRIEILDLAVDEIGLAVNPSTVIHWRRL